MSYRENQNPLESQVTRYEVASQLRQRASRYEALELKAYRQNEYNDAKILRALHEELAFIAESIDKGETVK